MEMEDAWCCSSSNDVVYDVAHDVIPREHINGVLLGLCSPLEPMKSRRSRRAEVAKRGSLVAVLIGRREPSGVASCI